MRIAASADQKDGGTVTPAPRSLVLRIMLIGAIMFGQAAQSAIFGVVSPVLPAMVHSFGLSHGVVLAQLLFALPSLGIMVFGLLSGAVLERYGLRRILLGSVIAYGILGSVPALTTSISVILISRLLLGVSCVILSTAATLLLVLTYSGAARSRMLGYQAGVGSVFAVVTTLASGIIGHALGWRLPFTLYAGAAALVALCVFFAVRQADAETPHGAAAGDLIERPAGGAGGSVIKILWPVYLAACLLFTLPMAFAAVLPFVLQQRGLSTSFEQSVLLSAFSMFSATGAFLFGRVREALGARSTFAAGFLLSAVGTIVIAICPNEVLTFTGAGLAGLGLGFYIPHLWVVATTVAPPSLRGRAAGLLTSSMYLGGFISPAILGSLSNLFGNAGTFAALGVLTGLALAGLFAMRPGILTTPNLVTPAFGTG